MRKLLYITVFIAGMTTLGLEMSASRLLGNYFGTSNLVWASIIGLIMIYLTAGYYLGGRLADRSPKFETLFKVLLWASFFTGIVPLVSRPVLRLAADAFDQLQIGILAGSFIGVLILFIIPVTMLGMTSPFAIRLAVTDTKSAGVTSGKISAISTIGSFIGTFLPVLILIPTIGTYRTFLAFSLMLMITCLIGLWKTVGKRSVLPFIWMPVVIMVLFFLGVQGTDKSSTGMIFEKESAYNYIQVLENSGFRTLRLNEGQGMHSVYHPTILNYHGPWEQVLAAPFFNKPDVDPLEIKTMAIVGLAAGTTARQAALVYPGIQIDGFEIDPVIVAVGQKYFGMTDPNLNVIVQDGRWGLEHSTKQYQVISVDAYRPPYIPAHMVTQEFFKVVFDHLTADGVMVINVGRAPNDRRMIDALYTTIHTIFPSAFVMDLPDTFNTIIFATKKPTQSQNLAQNYKHLLVQSDISPLLMDTLKVTIVNLQPVPTGGIVFTDDKAPVEWITNSMILNFFMTGQAETLQ